MVISYFLPDALRHNERPPTLRTHFVIWRYRRVKVPVSCNDTRTAVDAHIACRLSFLRKTEYVKYLLTGG